MASALPPRVGCAWQRSRSALQSYSRAIGIRHLRQRLRNKSGEISFGRLARFESHRRFQFPFDTVNPGTFASLCGPVPCHEIPAIAGMDDAVRLNHARAGRAGAVVIVEPNSFMIAAGAGDQRQALRIHGRTLTATSGTMNACRAATRWRNRGGNTCSSFISARTEASSMPVTLPLAAVRNPRATATASSSSSRSGGRVAPAPSW